MDNLIRHRAVVQNTGTRCAVVFRELPGDSEHCLVIESDSLPEIYRDEVNSVINKEGQKTKDLYEVLNISVMPTGENMLRALHEHKLLLRKETSNIMMQVTSSDTIRLDKLNDQLRALTDGATIKQPTDIQAKLNPYEEVNDAIQNEDSMNIAKNLLVQANDLEHEVSKKRERAYALRPELKPQATPLTEAEDSFVFTVNVKNRSEREVVQELKKFIKSMPTVDTTKGE